MAVAALMPIIVNDYTVCQPNAQYKRHFALPYTAHIKHHTFNCVLGDIPAAAKLQWFKTNCAVPVVVQCDRVCIARPGRLHRHVSLPESPVHPGTFTNFVMCVLKERHHLLDAMKLDQSQAPSVDPSLDVWVLMVSEIEAMLAIQHEGAFRIVVVSPQDVLTLLNYGLEFKEACCEYDTKPEKSKLEYFEVYCVDPKTKTRTAIQTVLFPGIPKDRLLQVDGYMNNFVRQNVIITHEDWHKAGRYPFLKHVEYRQRKMRFPFNQSDCHDYKQAAIDDRFRDMLRREAVRIQAPFTADR